MIDPIVHHVVETLHARAREADATITVAVPRDLAARGDADAIERIVLNLAENALRHGGRGVHVRIEGARAGDRVRVTVSDDGRGVATENRATIFDRFQRGATSEGSGLGLAIARELAHAMGGSLVLEGASTFALELPA